MKQKLGKRKRRALIRLRHALAAEKFIRWVDSSMGGSWDLTNYKPHNIYPLAWHQWHALGCP